MLPCAQPDLFPAIRECCERLNTSCSMPTSINVLSALPVWHTVCTSSIVLAPWADGVSLWSDVNVSHGLTSRPPRIVSCQSNNALLSQWGWMSIHRAHYHQLAYRNFLIECDSWERSLRGSAESISSMETIQSRVSWSVEFVAETPFFKNPRFVRIFYFGDFVSRARKTIKFPEIWSESSETHLLHNRLWHKVVFGSKLHCWQN